MAPVQGGESSMKCLQKPHSLHLFKLLFAALPTIVFGVFTVIFTLQQDASSRATREQDQRQADEVNRRQIFKEYIDDMEELLLHENFERNISRSLLHIRVRTLTALKHLDSAHKHDVIRFLYENRLIVRNEQHRVALDGADLTGMKFMKSLTERCELPHLYLPGVIAVNIIFHGCSLSHAVFDQASMTGATFDSCNIERSSFLETDLTGARLRDNVLYKTDFTGTFLTRTSISGGVFHDLNLTNVDLYQSDISPELLYPIPTNGLGPNVLINSRYPNGSIGDINIETLINHGRAHTQCHLNETSFWVEIPSTKSVQIINSSRLAPAVVLADTCFYQLSNGVMVGQHCKVSHFSLLNDLEQAMFNFSALVGLKHISNKDNIVITIHFIDEGNSFNYAQSLRKSVQPSSFFQVVSYVHLMPAKTRSLLITFECDAVSNIDDQFCLFTDVELFIFKKTL